MGMSVSRFSVLSNLLNGNQKAVHAQSRYNRGCDVHEMMTGFILANDVIPEAEQHLDFSRFKLTAIIVHDPNDESFKNYLKSKFDELSEMTGDMCLFISFISPDNPRYFYQESALSFIQGTDIDSVEEMEKVRRLFNLNGFGFPLLLLTDSIRSNSYYVIPTSESSVVKQLFDIKSFCRSQYGACKLQSPSVRQLVQSLDSTAVMRGCVKPIGRILADIEAEHIKRGDSPNEQRAKSIWRNKKILELKREIDWDRQSDEATTQKIDSLVDAYTPYVEYEHDSFNDQSNPYLLNPDRFEGCGEGTVNAMRQFNRMSCEYIRRINDYGGDTTTVTIMCSLLGRMFEKEIAYSIVQKMRESVGIEMPEYYCEYKPAAVDEYVVSNRFYSIDLNKYNENTHSLQYPELGPLKGIFIDMIVHEEIEVDEILASKQFTDLWDNMKNARNDTSHAMDINESLFEQAWTVFNIIWDDYLPHMIELKNQLRNSSYGKIVE